MRTIEADLVEPTIEWIRSAAKVERIWTEQVIPHSVDADWGLDLTGKVRADVAAITTLDGTSELWAWEIKSGTDNLDRLDRQARLYGTVADRCGIVADARHLDGAVALVPAWWDIVVADGIDLTEYRRGTPSPDVDPLRLVRFLWADEARLAARWWTAGIKSNTTRRVAWERLLDAAPERAIIDLAHTVLAHHPDQRPVVEGFAKVHADHIGGIPLRLGVRTRPQPADQGNLFG